MALLHLPHSSHTGGVKMCSTTSVWIECPAPRSAEVEEFYFWRFDHLVSSSLFTVRQDLIRGTIDSSFVVKFLSSNYE